MKFYFSYMKNVCKKGLVYRFDYIMRMIGSITALIVNYYIWKALLEQDTVVIDHAAVNLRYMVTYITISAVIRSFIRSGTTGEINQKIQSGSLAMDLIKPYNFMSLMFFKKVAEAIYQFVFFSIPLILFAAVFMGIRVPTLAEGIGGTAAALCGLVIMFLMEYILGLMGFWFQRTWILGRFLNDFIRLLSGAVIPMWVFPQSLQLLSKYLPFQYIYYGPITVLLGDKSIQLMDLLMLQGTWIVALYLVCVLLWNKSVHKITIQGG